MSDELFISFMMMFLLFVLWILLMNKISTIEDQCEILINKIKNLQDELKEKEVRTKND